ncbi:MAG: extracellular solute-binding protein, partial [Oscillospiraceae bacterium]|nr:extracellular solute-binding protein [Oscillospiraceae bacterium]
EASATSGSNGASGTTSAAPNVAPATTTTPGTTADPDENAATDKEAKDIASSEFSPDGNAGALKFLGYYDITAGSDQYLVFQTDDWGGSIEYNSCGSGPAYFEALGVLIAADDSPDLVTYEWLSYPGGMTKNMYEPLDEYIDLDAKLWADMKNTIEDFSYENKHYYYPYKIKNYFALNYSRKTVEDAGLKDPYDLYKEGNWTWDTWRELMIDFCNQDDENIGYCSTADVISSFVATTGVNFVDVQPDGTILNNLADPNVSRAMTFIESLNRDGLMYERELGDWVDPALWSVNSDRILFLGMEPEWCYTAATERAQNPAGVDNDVHDTLSDFAFVPFPRDPSSDTYHQAYDTFGYMVPKGAKNIKGAVNWIYCNRIYETDENVIAKAKQEHIAPEIVKYTAGKYEGMRKWTMTWDENVYDLMLEMRDPTKFEFNFDDCYGFSGELSSTIIGSAILNEVAFNGGSWAQLSGENSPLVDNVLDEYRK